MPSQDLSRRDLLGAATGAGLAALAPSGRATARDDDATKERAAMPRAQTDATPTAGGPPNILFILMDNLGYGEPGCYGGGLDGFTQWEVTIAAHFGTWRLGSTQGRLPNDQGFDEWRGPSGHRSSSAGPDPYQPPT
jgi:hypothetical protein